MEAKANFVADIAHALVNNNATMYVGTLVDILNHNKFTTQQGDQYMGGRGSYRLISTLYDYFKEIGYQKAADDIAAAFVKADGSYAYENE